MEILLREKDKQALVHIFSSAPLAIEVWAYGSRVNGTAHSGSDLDLVILRPNRQQMPVDAFTELRKKITESNIPILVDLFDWTRLPESFQLNIQAQHIVIFSNVNGTVNEPPADYKRKNDHSSDNDL